jgi:SsrA-binding protein
MNKTEQELRKEGPVQIKNKRHRSSITSSTSIRRHRAHRYRDQVDTAGKASLVDTFCYINNGELWVKGMNISPYFYGSYANHEARRDRKLLLNKREIRRLMEDTKAPGFTIVPFSSSSTARACQGRHRPRTRQEGV